MNAARSRARRTASTDGRRIAAAVLRAWPLPDPHDCSSKEDRGRVLIVGGSVQVPGAAMLAGIAALRAGAGKLQIATAMPAALPMAMAVPEAKVIGLPGDTGGGIRTLGRAGTQAVRHADAVAVGPGMDAGADARRVVAAVVEAAQGTVVLDAGALDLAALRAVRRRRGDTPLILTPHAGEMASLIDADEAQISAEPAHIACACAQAWGVVLVLKGGVTHIAAPDGQLWINTSGSVGLGTSGSGDVLAGLIAGLAARGAPPEQAAVWGVHLHARAGARLSRRMGLVGFLAREISGEIPGLMP